MKATLLIALLHAALAGEADLALHRHQAALAAGDLEGTWQQAALAVHADPLDWRAHRAWQDALLRANATWWVEAEYTALAADPDPGRRLMGLAWQATRAGGELGPVPGAPPQALALLQGELALERGRPREALAAVAGVEGPDAAAVRLAALAELDEGAALAREARRVRAAWPERWDLLAPLYQAQGLLPWLARCGALGEARAALTQDDPLTLYRAHTLFVAAGEPALAQEAAARLLVVGEPWALGSRPPWRGAMVRDLARVLALQAEPSLPPGGTGDENQRVLAATAREQARKGRPELAAGTWRKALAADPPDADLLLEAALALESAGAPPEELLGLARQAQQAVAASPELPHTAVQAQATLAGAWLLEARSLRALGDAEGALRAAQMALVCGAGPEALVMKAELLEARGQVQAAFSAYAQARALGVSGLEPALERLYPGPASAGVVLSAWPTQRATPDRVADADAPSFPTRTVNTSRGVVDLATQEVTVVVFWASWCGPCAQELPELDELAVRLDAQGLGVPILAVSVDEQERDYERWQRGHTLPNLHIARAPDLGRQAGVQGIPSTWVLGPGGEVIFFKQGYSPGDVGRLEAELRRLVEPATAP